MKNSWKRVAAGALSFAMVAGAMPANVGGLLTVGTAIVANAASDENINIYENQDSSGSHWSYSASTHTLTLDGYNYAGTNDGVTYRGTNQLTIELVGSNSIKTSRYLGHGIVCDVSNTALKISGEGSLDISCEGEAAVGIYTRGNMEFAGGNLNVSAQGSTAQVAIYNHDHNITISGGKVYAIGIVICQFVR